MKRNIAEGSKCRWILQKYVNSNIFLKKLREKIKI